MNIGLNAILLRFPNDSERIQKLIKENDEFENLCSDYELCLVMLKEIGQETESSQSKLQEYREIKMELEHELLKYL
jgi:hypothetical protein